jgi:hypothetical protein
MSPPAEPTNSARASATVPNRSAQLGLFDKQGYFEVTGGQTGRRYRIRYGTATNIHELDRYGHPTVGWCFVPIGPLVPGDVMLAQKIALETYELGALAVAKQFSPSWY